MSGAQTHKRALCLAAHMGYRCRRAPGPGPFNFSRRTGHIKKSVLATYSQQRCDATGTQHALTREGRGTRGHMEEGVMGKACPGGSVSRASW